MNTRESDNTLPGAEQVSSAYRAANFNEEPPAELDRAILAAATRHRRRPLASYLPSLALAATVVLSVSLVLRSGVLNENTETFSDEGTSAPDIRALPTSSLQELDEFVEPEAPPPQDSTAPGAGINTLGAVEGRSREAAENNRDEAVAPALPERAPLGVAANTAAAVRTICSNTDREEPAAWLGCIAALLEEGNEDEARRELAAFTQAYADYPLPADLDGQMEP